MLRQAQKEIGNWNVHYVDAPPTREDLIKWFDLMDDVLQRRKTMAVFITAAKSCNHPDAKWLASLFPEKGRLDSVSINVVFSKLADPRALYFRSLLYRVNTEEMCDDMLQRSADLGYAPAQALMSERTMGDEALKYAKKAALQGDREGMYLYSCCLGVQCERKGIRGLIIQGINPDTLWCKRAADLCHLGAIGAYANKFEVDDWQHYTWLGKAAICGDVFSRAFLAQTAADQMENSKELLTSTCSEKELLTSTDAKILTDTKILFEIGAIAQRMLSLGGRYLYQKDRQTFKQAAVLYASWRSNAKRAIFSWIWAGKQLGVVKDIRGVIAKMLWAEQREWSCA